MAPAPVADDLETVRDVFVRVRDAGGLATLLVFSVLQELERAIDEGAPDPDFAPYVPVSAHCSRGQFERGGFEARLDAWRGARADAR